MAFITPSDHANRLLKAKLKELTNDGEKVLAIYNAYLEHNMYCTYDLIEKQKDDSKAQALKAAANKEYVAENFLAALRLYNQSLCLSTENSDNISVIYSNRSAVYFALGYYETCLKNIDLALQYNCLPSIKSKLLKRQEDCLERINNQSGNRRHEDDRIEIALSYKPHKKYPCMVEGIELICDKKYGRSLVARKNFRPGDILINEKFMSKALDIDCTYQYCFWCLKGNLMSLLPCKESNAIMFCSDQCYNDNLQNGLSTEAKVFDALQWNHDDRFSYFRLVYQVLSVFDDFDELQQVLDSSSTKDLSAFDFDYASATAKDQVKAFLSLESHRDKLARLDNRGFYNLAAKMYHLVTQNCADLKERIYSDKQRITVMDAIYRTCRISYVNSFCLKALNPNARIMEDQPRVKKGFNIALIASFMNHSCASNAFFFSENSLAVAAERPIKAGDQITISYKHTHLTHTRYERQAYLKEEYHFDCECIACQKDYPTMKQMQMLKQTQMTKRMPIETTSKLTDSLEYLNLLNKWNVLKIKTVLNVWIKLFEKNDKFYPFLELCYSLEDLRHCFLLLYNDIPLQPPLRSQLTDKSF